MSQITKPVITDETGQQIVAKLHTQNMLLDVIAGAELEHTSNFDEIAAIVKAGNAATVFSVGDQIVVPWTDTEANRTYTMPFDVVHMGDVTLADGETVPGMFLQMHYAHAFTVQFSNYQAIQYYEEGLPAGTYYFTIGATWGTYCIQGTKYNFTLTKPIPAGGQLCGIERAPEVAPAEWRIKTYASSTAENPIETVTLTEGESGTDIGTLLPANDGALSLQRAAWGNNRYRDSAIRQYLNSAAAAGAWWTPQHNFDRPPAQLAQKAGFLSGFQEDFLSVLKPVKMQTAANTLSDGGTLDTLYDTFFLPSLEQMYFEPQATAGDEGAAWEYWKRAAGESSPLQRLVDYPQMRAFAVENHASPQVVRLRSAGRTSASYAWSVNSAGRAYTGTAAYAYRFCAACVIC